MCFRFLKLLMAVSVNRQTNWRASSSTDGKLKMWVYGVAAGAFVLLIFIVSMIYLAWWVDEFNFPYLSLSSFMKPIPFFPTRFWVKHPLPVVQPPSHHRFCLSSFFYFRFASLHAFILLCESSSYCAKVHRSLKAQESAANGTAVWVGQNAHEMIYTCPDCQELAQSSSSS